MQPTRVLGIAPYEGMRSLMVQLAAGMEDVALTAFVGDLAAGAAIAARYTAEDFDVILSRGGTAELIRAQTQLPVIDIELSLYDILRSMHLAESSNSRCALVGFPAITRNAIFLHKMLGYNVELYTIHDENEARTVLQKVAQEGCRMVLCDMITHSLANEYGLPAVLITSGSESVENALRQAVSIDKVFRPLRTRTRLLDAALRSSDTGRVLMAEEGAILYHSEEKPPEDDLCQKLRGYLPLVIAEGTRRFSVVLDGRQYNITGQKLALEGRAYALFLIKASSTRLSLRKNGIRFLHREEVVDRYFHSFYGVTQPGAAQLYEEYARQGTPALIVGEPGTGKEQMARMLYSQGAYRSSPICVIDCALLHDRGWTYLMENDSSPLMSNGNTIHFHHVHALEEEKFLRLFMLLRDTHYHQRNQLIFTAPLTPGAGLPEWARQVTGWFGCTLIRLPLLREHKEDIPQLATLYISSLNVRSGREVAGIEPGAMQLLEQYDWPGNYDQFKRILRELVMGAEDVSIRTRQVRRLLDQEALLYPASVSQDSSAAVRGKTMEEVEIMLARLAVAQAKGNRTLAAASLGISRTSLWRMLQRARDVVSPEDGQPASAAGGRPAAPEGDGFPPLE